MSYNLILNSSNVSPFNKNTFIYNFSDGAFQINESNYLCVSDITIPYSWYNISSQLNNNTFNFIDWLGVSHSIVIPNGFYTISDINGFLDTYFLNSGMYLINDQQQAVVYIYLYQNPTYYANQILLYSVPTSLPTGWSLGDGWIGFPSTPTTPTLQILNNNFQDYIGFSAGNYGGGSVDQSFLSNIVPNTTPVNSIIIQCNLVKNDAGGGGVSNILDTFPITSQFGANINYSPPFEKFMKLNPGRYNSLSITFLDNNLNNLPMIDTNVTISLLLKI